MATVYIHIGAPKTATSTLQSVFADSYSKLLKDGVLYPRQFRHGSAHHLLVCDLIEKYQDIQMPDIWYGPLPRGEAWSSLKAEIDQHGSNVEKVILSSELFFGQSEKIRVMLDDVVANLQGHEIRIIVYLRRQDQLYSSFYNQDVKGVRQWPESAYQFYQTHQIFQQDYRTLLDLWSGVFGKENLIIRPFEVEQWVNGDIVQDFCVAIGASPLRSAYKDHNESLGFTQLFIKKCLNKVGYPKEDNEEVLKVLAKVCPEEPVKGGSYVNRGLYRRYRQEWLGVNTAISRNYLDGEELFRQQIPLPEDVQFHKIDKLKVAGYTQNMFKIFNRGKYPDYRALFARATLLALAEQNLWHALEEADRHTMMSWI